MKLSIPTNWRRELLEQVNREDAVEIYGKLREDIFGGGRSSVYLPFVSKNEAKEHIAEVHKYGLRFNYLLNSLCLGNLEWTPSGQKKIRKFIDWLEKIGVDSITVSQPYMLQMIKKCYPHFEVNVSINSDVNSPLKAESWENLGADQITLSLSVNRNFRLLRQIRKKVKCRLQLIANLLCFSEYPFCIHHYLCVGHNSQEGSRMRKDSYYNYYPMLCRYLSLLEPKRLISSGWIRPEDLRFYEEAGIERIKLVDRRMKTRILLRVVEAYTRRKYEGNLFDLFFYRSSQRNSQFSKGLIRKLFDYFLSLKDMNVLKIYREIKCLQSEDPILLDNKKLDNFIAYFLEGKCDFMDCRECNYCRTIAEKALYIPQDYKENMLKAYGGILDRFLDGSLFYAKNGIKSQSDAP